MITSTSTTTRSTYRTRSMFQTCPITTTWIVQHPPHHSNKWPRHPSLPSADSPQVMPVQQVSAVSPPLWVQVAVMAVLVTTPPVMESTSSTEMAATEEEDECEPFPSQVPVQEGRHHQTEEEPLHPSALFLDQSQLSPLTPPLHRLGGSSLARVREIRWEEDHSSRQDRVLRQPLPSLEDLVEQVEYRERCLSGDQTTLPSTSFLEPKSTLTTSGRKMTLAMEMMTLGHWSFQPCLPMGRVGE